MNRENLKFIVSAILVILIVSLGIYGFVFRNEISNKIQEISRRPETEEKVERLILEPDKPAAGLEDFEKLDEKNKVSRADSSHKQNTAVPEEPLKEEKPDTEGETAKKEMLHELSPPAPREKTSGSMDSHKQEEPEKEISILPPKSEKETPTVRKTATKKIVKKTGRKRTKKKSSRKRKKSGSGRLDTLEKRISRLEKKAGINSRKNLSIEKRIQRLETKLKQLEK